MAASPDMNRKDFLQLFGLGATALVATACLGGCGSKSVDPVVGATSVDFTVDLTAASSAPLNNPAVGYIYNSTRDVIVAKTTAGTYVALQAPCPHEGTSVYFSPGQSRFICPNHNAIFDVGGTVLSGPSPRALKQYAVVQTANSLHITG
ncbi:MAG: Rieske (2Fe-2S) protein [Bacteroidota bacterium]|nr:Rieske (2Fe-2S) protein [Bacteroidota bacterium]